MEVLIRRSKNLESRLSFADSITQHYCAQITETLAAAQLAVEKDTVDRQRVIASLKYAHSLTKQLSKQLSRLASHST